MLLFLEPKAFVEEAGIVIAHYENVYPSPLALGDDAVQERCSYAPTSNKMTAKRMCIASSLPFFTVCLRLEEGIKSREVSQDPQFDNR